LPFLDGRINIEVVGFGKYLRTGIQPSGQKGDIEIQE